MYRRPRFLEKLLEARCEMAAEADYDVELFLELARSGDRNPVRLHIGTGRSKNKQNNEGSEISPAKKASGHGTNKI